MRQSQLLQCGKGYASALEAASSKRGARSGAVVHQCLNRACGKWHVKNPPGLNGLQPARRRRETGFPAAVRVMTRVRAGRGDADQALCEACGKFLGRYRGEVQHRLARKAGGSRSPVVNGISNAALLCGNRYEGCHKLAEDRDPDMGKRGFWIRDGNGPEHDPRLVPVMVMSPGGARVSVLLLDDGSYGPWEAAA